MRELTPKYAQYLRDLVKRAGDMDREYEVFGAYKHRYQLNPVLPMEKVSAYEAKNQITLPSEYKFFITQVGNGGAGPDYGIYSLKLDEPYTNKIGTPFISSKLTKTQWKEKLQSLQDEDCPDDVFDLMEEELLQGTYALGTKGCSYENITVTNGEDENRVFYIDFDWDEEAMPYDTGMNFLTWYELFFQEIIHGNNVSGYGYHIIASEEELVSRFVQSNDKKTRSDLLDSFSRFRQVSANTCAFFSALSNEEFPRHKLALLLRYEPQEGIRLFERFLKEKPLVAITESTRVPKEELPRFYEDMRHLLYTMEDGSEPLKFYSSAHSILMSQMSECPQMCAGDIATFLKKDGITERDRQDAMYYMGKAWDKITELDTFIREMQEGPYWVSHAALQAVSDVNSSKLKPVLLELWKRYREDSCMRSNLKIAFRTNYMELPK